MVRSRGLLYHGVRRRTLRSGLRQVDVDDVFQDAALRALGAATTLRATCERGFRAWFLGIARNVLLERRRRHGARVTPTDDLGDVPERTGGGDGGPPEGDSRGVVWGLRPDQRSAVVLRTLFVLGWEDVATVLDRPTRSAARLVHVRARRRIDRRLEGVAG